MCGGLESLRKIAGSYLFSATHEGFAGGPFHEVNQFESLHYVQPLMAERSEGGRESDRRKKKGSGLTINSSCAFVS